MTTLLSLDDIAVRIGATDILHGVSLSLQPGAAVGLVGETGSGKTMTVRAATGLLGRLGGRITRGTVRVAGQDVTHAREKDWRRWQGYTVALVPQSSMSSLDPLMSVGAQLNETIRVLNRRAGRAMADERDEASRLLDSVRLRPDAALLAAYPHELSGGMRQRVMIALALAGGPRLLVADEPTTAVDAEVRSHIIDLLAELRRKQGLGLLLVSHDLGTIRTATDTTVVMYGGRTVETGPTERLFTAPAHPYTQALLDALPQKTPPGQPLPTIRGQPPHPGEIGPGCPFAPRCPRVAEVCRRRTPPVVAVAAERRQVACHRPQLPVDPPATPETLR